MIKIIQLLLKFGPWLGMLLAIAWSVHMGDLRSNWETKFNAEVAAHRADVTSYRNAQKAASIQNQAHIAKVTADRQKVTDDVEKTLNDRIAALRLQLREQSHSTPAQRPSDRASTPDVPSASKGTDETPRVCIPSSQFLLGAEYEEKLDEWVTWANAQMGIDPNK